MTDSETNQANRPQRQGWLILRRCLVGLAVCLTLVCFYYTEELWRGKSAWENCKKNLEAQGANFDWARHTPTPVPDDQNVFGVPEMQQWFVGRGATELSQKLAYPEIVIDYKNGKRMTVAELSIGLPGTAAPQGFTTLRWDDPAARAEAARLLTNAVGPTANAPQSPVGFGLMLIRPGEIQPTRIFLQCQTTPAEAELEKFLPDNIFVGGLATNNALLKIEPNGSGSYHVTMPVLAVADDYLAFTEQSAPEFALIRQALRRPYAQMKGDYSKPEVVPIPNFVTARIFVQVLGARAECHFLLNQPDEALRDMTLMNDCCHPIMEENAVMTLVSAMINGAVRGLYVDTIAGGWRLQAWREPQWAALEEQLKQINVVAPVKTAFEFEREATTFNLENASGRQVIEWMTEIIGPSGQMSAKPTWWVAKRNWLLGELLPRGWIYQNMVTHCTFSTNLIASMDSSNEIIFPEKADAWQKQYDAVFGHWSPDSFISKISTPNFTRACKTIAQHQTKVNQALVVCALERFRLAHGEYPETLDALVPQFLDKIPRDVIGGEPPHYRRAGDGKFLLYSTGWSGRDGGGVSGGANSEGDWVWPNI